MKLGIASVVLVGLMTLAQAQQPAAVATADDPCSAHPSVGFDVATIKPSDKPAGGSSMHRQADSLTSSGVLRRLILFAYDLRDFQVTGGPDWVNTQVWEIRATVDPPDPDGATLDAAGRQALIDSERQRLQSLLADRFHFKCHIAAKELPIYELVSAKGGAKLTQTTAPAEKQHSISSNGNGRRVNLVATGIGMDDAAKFLSSEVGRRVVDKTRLTGSYDITLTWMPAMASAADADAASGPTIFTALEEQLGLKLVTAKGPVQVLVMDAVEKPSEN
jgi:bla regulator protein BlaR1